MNDKEDWPANKNPYGDFVYSQLSMPPAFNVGARNSWVHVPPQTMPWGVPVESQPSVVRFTGRDFNGHMSCAKRRSHSPSDVPPAKMLVTEEKMAAHMQGLHISDVEPQDCVRTAVTYKDESMDTEQLPKLVVCDEIKNLKTDTIFPESILKRLEKPDMQLVLWRPPPPDLDSRLRELKKLSKTVDGDRNEEEQEEEDAGSDAPAKPSGDMDVEVRDDVAMDVVGSETRVTCDGLDRTFRPIDPVPMPPTRSHYYQPVPQFHRFSPFS